MPIIVAGKLWVEPVHRETVIKQSQAAMIAARKTPGCYDFAVSPDPLEPTRINIFEHWETLEALQIFRAKGPDSDIGTLIKSYDIQEHLIP